MYASPPLITTIVLFLAESRNGHPKTQTMQNADTADCAFWVLFSNNWLTFFRFYGSKVVFTVCYLSTGRKTHHLTVDSIDNAFNRLCMGNPLCWSSINVLKLGIKIDFHTYAFKAKIASLFYGFVVCRFNSFVQFVVVVLFSISLVFLPLLTDS